MYWWSLILCIKYFFLQFFPLSNYSSSYISMIAEHLSRGPGDSVVWFIVQGCTTMSLCEHKASYLKFLYVYGNNNALMAKWNYNCHWWSSSPNEETFARQYKPICRALFWLPCIFSHYWYLYCRWWNMSVSLAKVQPRLCIKGILWVQYIEAQSIALVT